MRKNNQGFLLFILLLLVFFSSCISPRKILNDEVVLKNGSSETGSITSCDSTKILLKNLDLSTKSIPWTEVDSVRGLAYRSRMITFRTGIYNTPYFSVFRNQRFSPTGLGWEFQFGKVRYRKTYRYWDLARIHGSPYSVTKLGYGIQRYFLGDYTKSEDLFGGIEVNLMFISNNNAPQITFEPFLGTDIKLGEQFILNYKLGLQKNFSGKNNNLGINFTVGLSFLRRNFKNYYQYINTNRKLPVNYNP